MNLIIIYKSKIDLYKLNYMNLTIYEFNYTLINLFKDLTIIFYMNLIK